MVFQASLGRGYSAFVLGKWAPNHAWWQEISPIRTKFLLCVLEKPIGATGMVRWGAEGLLVSHPPILTRAEIDGQRHFEFRHALHLLPHHRRKIGARLFARFEDQFIMNLKDHRRVDFV